VRSVVLILLGLTIPALGAGISGCGAAKPPAATPVKLSLTAPTDGSRVSSGSVTVTGTVSPVQARVLVLGQRVTVQADGSFSTDVLLSTGTNLIDVLASAPHAPAAMSAVRVVRYALETVPQVIGDSPSDAQAAIRAAGLVPKVVSSGSPFNFLVPLSTQVCSTSPSAGTKLSPGSTVTVNTGKLCV
jgi:hypothetical protein